MSFKILPLSYSASALQKMRDRSLALRTFRVYSDNVTRELVERFIPPPRRGEKIVIPILILRAGLAFQQAFLDEYHTPIGLVGIERQDVGPAPLPKIYYWKVPARAKQEDVLWVVADPMFATGGSMVLTMTKLIELGIPPKRIRGLCVFAAPEAVAHLHNQDWGDQVTVWGAALDGRLDSRAYIVPGCGDYGDRYFGTDGASGLLDLD